MKTRLEPKLPGRTPVKLPAPPTPHARRREPASRAAPARDFARQLAEEVCASLHQAQKKSAPEPSEIVLDRHLSGYRIVVMRAPPESEAGPSFSPRELEIARMIAKGYPNKMIAAVLEISSWTVGTHLRRVFAKLGVTSRAAMVARMMELGHTENWPPLAR